MLARTTFITFKSRKGEVESFSKHQIEKNLESSSRKSSRSSTESHPKEIRRITLDWKTYFQIPSRNLQTLNRILHLLLQTKPMAFNPNQALNIKLLWKTRLLFSLFRYKAKTRTPTFFSLSMTSRQKRRILSHRS